MARLIIVLIALAGLAEVPAAAAPLSQWRPHIEEASARFGLPKDWIENVIMAESGGRIMIGGRPTRSKSGAMGLMQLMPGTWADMSFVIGLGLDPHNPRENILAGSAYLRQMYDRFGFPGLFAAYHAGPARYADHLATGRPLPLETLAYVRRVATPFASEQHAPTAFLSRLPDERSPAPGKPSSAIFVILSSDAPPGRNGSGNGQD